MMSREMAVSNFMEALLRAALILGDRSKEPPVKEIRILSFDAHGPGRQLHTRCRIIMEPLSQTSHGERLQIVYPESARRVS